MHADIYLTVRFLLCDSYCVILTVCSIDTDATALHQVIWCVTVISVLIENTFKNLPKDLQIQMKRFQKMDGQDIMMDKLILVLNQLIHFWILLWQV